MSFYDHSLPAWYTELSDSQKEAVALDQRRLDGGRCASEARSWHK